MTKGLEHLSYCTAEGAGTAEPEEEKAGGRSEEGDRLFPVMGTDRTWAHYRHKIPSEHKKTFFLTGQVVTHRFCPDRLQSLHEVLET